MKKTIKKFVYFRNMWNLKNTKNGNPRYKIYVQECNKEKYIAYTMYTKDNASYTLKVYPIICNQLTYIEYHETKNKMIIDDIQYLTLDNNNKFFIGLPKKEQIGNKKVYAQINTYYGGKWAKQREEICEIEPRFFSNGNMKKSDFKVISEFQLIAKGYQPKNSNQNSSIKEIYLID